MHTTCTEQSVFGLVLIFPGNVKNYNLIACKEVPDLTNPKTRCLSPKYKNIYAYNPNMKLTNHLVEYNIN